MKTRVEDLTKEQLDVLVAEKVMKWVRTPAGFWQEPNGVTRYSAIHHAPYDRIQVWSPTTNIRAAFEVDKPDEWLFDTYELMEPENYRVLAVDIREAKWFGELLAHVRLPLDRNNKIAAHCRGRCIAACYACGIKEVDDV